MEELLARTYEKAKTDKKAFRLLKEMAVRCRDFELAAKLREMELELFPESEETKQAKQRAKEINLLFRMVDLNVQEDVCWLIDAALGVYRKKKGGLTIHDTAKLVAKRKELFDSE